MDDGLDLAQFRTRIVRPTLHHLRLHSQAAENLVVGTALAESGLRYLTQLGGGPALGLYQVEPATHADVWQNYLDYRPTLAERVGELQTVRETDLDDELVGNLFYATAICRLIYRRRPEPLPGADNAAGLAAYHKCFYNTALGAATIERTILHFRIACR